MRTKSVIGAEFGIYGSNDPVISQSREGFRVRRSHGAEGWDSPVAMGFSRIREGGRDGASRDQDKGILDKKLQNYL